MTESQFKQLCQSEIPSNAIASVEGTEARHIPIGELENLLDELEYSTSNFQYQMYKDGYANLCVAASLELSIRYETEKDCIERTFVGACNFPISSISPNQHFLATAKSECIKNAASDIGKYFGRGINDGIVPSAKMVVDKPQVKSRPDSKIMQQFTKALEEGDEATINMLTNIYDIKTQ